MRHTYGNALWVCALFAASACGGSETSVDVGPGATSARTSACGEYGSVAALEMYFEPYVEWLRVPVGYEPVELGKGREPHPEDTLFEFDPNTVLRAAEQGIATQVFLGDDARSEFEAHTGSERLIAVETGLKPALTGRANLILTIDSSGAVTPTDPCADVLYSQDLNEIADVSFPGSDSKALTALLAAIEDPSAVPDVMRVLAGGEPEVDWNSLSPDARVVSHEFAPPEVVARFLESQAYISMPDEWREMKFVFCSRTEVGWNEYCSASYSAGGPGLPVWLRVYFEPGSELQIYLADDRRGTQQPLALLTTIQTDRETANLSIAVSSAVTITDLEGLVKATREGLVDVAVERAGGSATPLETGDVASPDQG